MCLNFPGLSFEAIELNCKNRKDYLPQVNIAAARKFIKTVLAFRPAKHCHYSGLLMKSIQNL
jgi:hypothetical protein